MKMNISILILLAFTKILSAQQVFYYYQGNAIPLRFCTEKVYVKFEEGITETKKIQIAASIPFIKSPDKRNLEYPNNIAVFDILQGRTELEVKAVIEKLNKNEDIVVANPFVLYPVDSTLQGISEQFIVKLRTPSDFSELLRLAKETNTKLLKQNEFEPSTYIILADKNSNGNALEMANYFQETGKFEFAEPNFLKFLKKNCVNDTYFGDQWALQNSGQQSGTSGADIKACQAWEITTGRNVIRIAVIDEGTDLNHPDLIDNLASGYDATGQGSYGAPQGDDAHGTATAGVIAARGNNGSGVSGIAYNCTIVPVRIAYGNNNACDASHQWITLDSWIADGINWACDPQYGNADILSNSWGGGSPATSITNAIQNAVNNERNGLGCPVLFSSGNNGSSSVSYPANLQEVIAVGATTRNDVRATFSQYGSDLDIVAPGENIVTLDISGSAGYSNSGCAPTYNADYISSIDGTSFSCPYAAGTMALILSVNRCLTQADARKILELSCDKVSGLCYNTTSGHPTSTWNEQMGYGRINAYNAVRYAFSTQVNSYSNVSGSDQGAIECDGNLCSWALVSGGCSGLAAATYFVYKHYVYANVTYPFISGATILGISNGFSMANPNNGNYFMGISNVTSTSATLYSYVYEAYNYLGQFLGWVPTAPQNIRFNYSVLSIIDQELYFQNQTVSTGTEIYNAMNKIEIGNNVTNAVPVGDYIIGGDANITFHAGNVGYLEPGAIISPGLGGSVNVFVDPFFTCTQFPLGKTATNMDSYPPVINEYEVTKQESKSSTLSDKEIFNLNIFPNPTSANATIEYTITKSEFVEITLYDNCGRPLYKLKNKSPHEAGKYQIKLDGINLLSGTYYCILKTDSHQESKELIIVK